MAKSKQDKKESKVEDRTITVPAGIGDSIWLIQKLINSGEKFHIKLPDSTPQRGKQIWDLIPQVALSCTYVPGLSYKKLEQDNIQERIKLFNGIKETEFSLSLNKHLEHGHRIEDFLPDLETSFKIDWRIPFKDVEDALEYYNTFLFGEKLIGIYCSSYSSSRNWGFWDENKWLDLIKMIHKHNSEYKFIIIGAEWDTDLSSKLISLLEKNNIPFESTIGRSLGFVIELMKMLHYFFSFPSGLGILAPTVNCKVTMFYPKGDNGSPNLSKMLNTWASKEDIESGDYKGCTFCTPQQIFEWCVKHGKI